MTNGVRLLRLLDFSSCDLPVFSATRQSVPFGWESRTQKVLRRIIHTCSARAFSPLGTRMSLVLVLTLVVGWSPREEISWVLNGTIGSCWWACAVGDLLIVA